MRPRIGAGTCGERIRPAPGRSPVRDGKKITDMDLGFKEKIALHEVLKKISGTDLEKLLKEYEVI